MAPRGKKTKATPVYQVFNISPANKGVRALTTFKPGDVIISEEPLFNLFLPLGPLRKFQDLHPPDVPGSSSTVSRKRHIDCMKFNAFNRVQPKGTGQQVILRVYDDISRINHSCRPNACYVWGAKSSRIVALQELRNGDEVTITYDKGSSYQGHDGRRVHYRQNYDFECQCPACPDPAKGSVELRKLKESNERRVRMGSLRVDLRLHCPTDPKIKLVDARKALSKADVSPDIMPGKALELVRLLQAEGIGDDRYVEALYFYAYYLFVNEQQREGWAAHGQASEVEKLVFGGTGFQATTVAELNNGIMTRSGDYRTG